MILYTYLKQPLMRALALLLVSCLLSDSTTTNAFDKLFSIPQSNQSHSTICTFAQEALATQAVLSGSQEIDRLPSLRMPPTPSWFRLPIPRRAFLSSFVQTGTALAVGSALIAQPARAQQAAPSADVPYQTDAQLNVLKKWANASRLFKGGAAKSGVESAMTEAKKESAALSLMDPGWSEVDQFFIKFQMLYQEAEGVGALPEDWYQRNLKLAQDLNDAVLTRRGWLITTDTKAKEGFLLEKLSGLRGIIVTSVLDGTRHREPMAVWSGEPVDIGSGLERTELEYGLHAGIIGRHTISLFSSRGDSEYNMLVGFCDPNSDVSKNQYPQYFRRAILAGLVKDGLVVPDPKEPDPNRANTFIPVADLREILDQNYIEHEASHAMKSRSDPQIVDEMADQIVAKLSQLTGRMAWTRLMFYILTSTIKNTSPDAAVDQIRGAVAELAFAMDDEVLAQRIRDQDEDALASLLEKLGPMSQASFQLLAKKARTHAGRNLPGPTDYTIEYGRPLPTRPVETPTRRANRPRAKPSGRSILLKQRA